MSEPTHKITQPGDFSPDGPSHGHTLDDRTSVRGESSAPPEGNQLPLGGRYVLLDEIARGGMGVVYRATDAALGREVAVKVLQDRFGSDSGAARRFLDEARITGQLQHPAIPPVHDLGELPSGRPYLAMKLVKGRTLDALLKERPDPSADRGRFVAAFEQLCQAVAYAHAHKVIHRDLKPSNVMVGAFGEVQVMDWGLAKVLGTGPRDPAARAPDDTAATEIRTTRDSDGAYTLVGSVMGTPAYMPPEQAGGEVGKIDERSDVFGLGAILCVVLSGSAPYVAPDPEVVRLMAIRGQLADGLARLDKCGADPGLVALCKKCLSFDPADRPADARAVADEVAALRAAAEQRARRAELDRVRAEAEAREQRKRRRVLAALAASVLAAAVVAAASWRWVERARAAQRAQTSVAVNHELGRSGSLRDQAAAVPLADPERRAESARLWAEALAAADKAEAALEAGPADPAVADRAREEVGAVRAEAAAVARDRALLDRLDRARERRAEMRNDDLGRVHPRARIIFGYVAADEYAAALRADGLDVLAVPPAEFAAVVRARPRIGARVAAALDDWLALEVERPAAERLLAAAREIDPDPFRNRLRAAVAGLDRGALLALARESEGADLGPPAALLLADGLHLAGEMERAAAVLRRARARHPDDFWINDVLGVYVLGGDPSRADEAARYFSAAIALRPASAFVYGNLGLALAHQCRWAEALETLEAARRLDPGYDKFVLDVAEVLLSRQEPGDIDRAVESLKELVRRNPGFSPARTRLATAYGFQAAIRAGRGDRAGADTLKAAALEAAQSSSTTGSVEVARRCALGEALLVNDRPAEAIVAFEDALRLSPDCALAYEGLTHARLQLKEYPAALAAAEVLRAKAPNDPGSHVTLGIVHFRRGAAPDAIAAYRRAIALRPAAWHLRVGLSQILLAAGGVDEALAEARAAVELAPRVPDARAALGDALSRRGLWTESIAAYKEAERLDPAGAPAFNWSHSLARRGLANELFKKGDRTGAVAEARESVRLAPSDPFAHQLLGWVLWGAGDRDGAIVALKEAVRLDPKSDAMRNDLAEAVRRRTEWEGRIAPPPREVKR